jgi:hypothetical protein
MALPARYDIIHYEGDTFTLTIQLEGSFLASTPKFEIKVPNSASPSLELSSGSGITVGAYNPLTNRTTFTITITSAQSTTLGSSAVYWYDFEMNTGGVITTYLSGSFTQQQQVSI